MSYVERLKANGRMNTLERILEECRVTPIGFDNVQEVLRDLFDPTVTSIDEGIMRRACGLDKLITAHSWDLTIDLDIKREARFRALLTRWGDTKVSLLGPKLRHSASTASVLDWQPETQLGQQNAQCQTLRCNPSIHGERLRRELHLRSVELAGLDYLIALLMDHTLKFRWRKRSGASEMETRNVFVTKWESLSGDMCTDAVELQWEGPDCINLTRGAVPLKNLLERADLLVYKF